MSAGAEREHQWDSLRAFLMLLGIPYHAAMAYNTRALWDVQSPDKSDLLTFLSGILVTFRMPAFFIVAGYFAAMLLSRRNPLDWLRGRFIRLGIPFLTGLVLLAPPQLFFIDLELAMNGLTTMQQAMNRAAYDMTHPGFGWIMHLWFLPALLAYSTLLAIIWHLIQARTPGSSRNSHSLRLGAHPALVLVLVTGFAILWEIAIHLAHTQMLALSSPLAYLVAHGIDPYLRYLPFFLLGVLLRSVPELRPSLVWQGGWMMPAAAIAAAILSSELRARPGLGVEIIHITADGMAAILMSAVVIGIASRYGNRPNHHVDRIVDASFTIYLLHHPLIYALVTLFLLTAWPPLVEFLIVCAATFALSFGLHQLIRRSRLALFLFNGIPIRQIRPSPLPPSSLGGTLR